MEGRSGVRAAGGGFGGGEGGADGEEPQGGAVPQHRLQVAPQPWATAEGGCRAEGEGRGGTEVVLALRAAGGVSAEEAAVRGAAGLGPGGGERIEFYGNEGVVLVTPPLQTERSSWCCVFLPVP